MFPFSGLVGECDRQRTVPCPGSSGGIECDLAGQFCYFRLKGIFRNGECPKVL